MFPLSGHTYSDSTSSPPNKRKKLGGKSSSSGLADWMASDVGDVHEDDLEVYGAQAGAAAAATTTRIASYSFEVCDSLLNIGPCGQAAMGEPAFLSEELSSSTKADPDVELVTTSGHGKNGALCVLQQSVRPQVVTTFELPGCRDMWTVTAAQPTQKTSSNAATLQVANCFNGPKARNHFLFFLSMWHQVYTAFTFELANGLPNWDGCIGRKAFMFRFYSLSRTATPS